MTNSAPTITDPFEEELARIKELAASAADVPYYTDCYALMRFMNGDPQMLEEINAGRRVPGGNDDEDLPWFPDITPEIDGQGVQNHALVNSRIMIQSIVFSDAEIHVTCDSPPVKSIVKGWLKKRWRDGAWSPEFYQTGMEVEATGVSFCEIGMVDGRVTTRFRSMLDTLWDPIHRSPEDWEFVFFRNRLSVSAALKKYGASGITREELEAIAKPILIGSGSGNTRGAAPGPKVVIEWSFWSPTAHCTMLGGIKCACSEKTFGLNESNEYQRGLIGANPFGVIPAAVWVDSWTPGARRPTGKMQTTWKVSSMLNRLEVYLRETLWRGLPMTILSSVGLTTEQIESIKNARGPEDLERVIVTEMFEDVSKGLMRVPASDLPVGWIQAVQYYKDQVNAATGVMDAERGQALHGERRTAFEYRMLASSQGVQAKHAKSSYSAFLNQVVAKAKLIASMYESAPTVIHADGIVFDTKFHDLKAVLAYDCEMEVQENSLQYMSEDELRGRRIQQFQMVDMPAINLGVADPYKVIADVYREHGITDPTKLMVMEDEYRASQEQIAASEQMQQAPQPQGVAAQGEQNVG